MDKVIKEQVDKCRAEVEQEIFDNKAQIEDLHDCIKGMRDDFNGMREDHKNLHADHISLGSEISSKIGKLENQLNRLEKSINKVLDIFEAGEGFARVMSWLGRIAKWVTVIFGAIAAFWMLVKHGGGHG
jgi:DNA repair exonuclease SbcCD ATPase subunit